MRYDEFGADTGCSSGRGAGRFFFFGAGAAIARLTEGRRRYSGRGGRTNGSQRSAGLREQQKVLSVQIALFFLVCFRALSNGTITRHTTQRPHHHNSSADTATVPHSTAQRRREGDRKRQTMRADAHHKERAQSHPHSPL